MRKDCEYLPETNVKGNLIINLEVLNQHLLSSVKCSECDSDNSIELREKPFLRKGLAVMLSLVCKNCSFEKEFYSSKVTESKPKVFDVNLRCVYGLRSIGKGKATGNMLCAIMDLPKPPTKFQKYNQVISKAIEEVAEEVMFQPTREAVIENDGDSDIANVACFNGTWQKRGHTSLNGVFTVTSMDTGKVLDAVRMSKYCSCSEKLKRTDAHLENCSKNYEGTSGGMEVVGAKQVFQNSIRRGVRFVKYLDDGDSSAFLSVVKSNPYGEVNITKLECVGHVQKRMGSRLRTLKKKYRGVKLSDNMSLGGKGRLTDALIDSL